MANPCNYILQGSEKANYFFNGHGDVTALVNSQGTVIATYQYDAFGNPKEKTGTADNPFRYSGYQYDEGTQLYYLNARMYDPVTARFMQEDTYLGKGNDPLSLNRYTYCHNNPVKYWDPTGHAAVVWQKEFTRKAKESTESNTEKVISTIKAIQKSIYSQSIKGNYNNQSNSNTIKTNAVNSSAHTNLHVKKGSNTPGTLRLKATDCPLEPANLILTDGENCLMEYVLNAKTSSSKGVKVTEDKKNSGKSNNKPKKKGSNKLPVIDEPNSVKEKHGPDGTLE